MSVFDKRVEKTLEEREKEAEARLAALKKEMSVIEKEKEARKLAAEVEQANPSFRTKLFNGLENMADNIVGGKKR